MRKSYKFTVKYNIENMRDDIMVPYIFADAYLVRLMKDFNVVYTGVETDMSTLDRELFFRALSLETTLNALAEFSDNDKDFTKSFMDKSVKTSLTMEYSAEQYTPFDQGEIEYTKDSINHDPRETVKMLEEMEAEDLAENEFEDDEFEDDEFGDN